MFVGSPYFYKSANAKWQGYIESANCAIPGAYMQIVDVLFANSTLVTDLPHFEKVKWSHRFDLYECCSVLPCIVMDERLSLRPTVSAELVHVLSKRIHFIAHEQIEQLMKQHADLLIVFIWRAFDKMEGFSSPCSFDWRFVVCPIHSNIVDDLK